MGDDAAMQHRRDQRRQQKPRAARPFNQQHQRPYNNRRQPMHQEHWHRYADQTQQPNSSETLVHFHKSFGVMQEIFEHPWFHGLGTDLLRLAEAHTLPGMVSCPSFLDLGCAPGGFSACLLQDSFLGPNSVGYGVSLPYEQGGFEMLLSSERYFVQLQDILTLEKHDLLCADNSLDLCLGDAQYLSCLFKNKQSYSQQQYTGTKVRSKALGIWSLTVKECSLAFSKLRHGGSFIFRFGWRGIGSGDAGLHPSGEQVAPELLEKYLHEEEWYKALTHWLFSVLKSLFSTLKPFKSEYVHQADVSFYMVCRGFDRTKYEQNRWEAKLQRSLDEIGDCEDELKLIANIKNQISAECKAEIDDLLEVVGRMRAIGIESRKVTNPNALRKWEDPNSTRNAEAKKNGSSDDKAKDAPAPAPSESSTTAESCGTSTSSVPQATTSSSTKVSTPPAPSESSTTAESCSASTASVPQVPEASNGTATDRRESTKSSDPPIEEGETPQSNKNDTEETGAASIARGAGSSLGGTSGAGGSTSSTGGSKASSTRKGQDNATVAGKSRGRDTNKAKKQNWENQQWTAQQRYDYGAPASTGNWTGNGRYLSIAEQVPVTATNVDSAYVAMEAEYRQQQLQYSMYQSQLNGQQLVNGGGFQPQMHWPQAEMMQDNSLQQVTLNGIGPAESPEWVGDMMSQSSDVWQPWMVPSSQDVLTVPGPRSRDVLQLNQLVDSQSNLQQDVLEWPGVLATGHSSGGMLEPTTPAVSSSTPAVAAVAEEKTESNREGSALSEVLPSLLSLPAKRTMAREATEARNESLRQASTTAEVLESRQDKRRNNGNRHESDSDSSLDDSRGGRNRGYRYKRRSGRSVRERRYGPGNGNGYRPKRTRDDDDGSPLSSLLLRLKVLFSDSTGLLPRGDLFVQAMRCGLFCAMAWSVNSIIFSSMKIYNTEGDETLVNASVQGGVQDGPI